MFDRFRRQTEHEEQGYEPVEVGSDLVADLDVAPPLRQAVTVRPNEDNGGIEAMDGVLESLHAVRQESPRFRRKQENVSPAHAFEARYAPVRPGGDRVVTLQYVAGEDRLDGTLERQLRQQYPDCELDRRDPTLLDVGPGMWVAGATLALRRYTLHRLN